MRRAGTGHSALGGGALGSAAAPRDNHRAHTGASGRCPGPRAPPRLPAQPPVVAGGEDGREPRHGGFRTTAGRSRTTTGCIRGQPPWSDPFRTTTGCIRGVRSSGRPSGDARYHWQLCADEDGPRAGEDGSGAGEDGSGRPAGDARYHWQLCAGEDGPRAGEDGSGAGEGGSDAGRTGQGSAASDERRAQPEGEQPAGGHRGRERGQEGGHLSRPAPTVLAPGGRPVLLPAWISTAKAKRRHGDNLRADCPRRAPGRRD